MDHTHHYIFDQEEEDWVCSVCGDAEELEFFKE
jgi:hypothetical protein